MLVFTDIIGIIAFAISGFIVGVRNKLDLLGITISSFLTALGGGIIRDVLAKKEIYAFNDPIPGIIVICVILIGVFFKFHRYDFEKSSLFILSDSIGLVSFSVSGALVGMDVKFNLFGVVFLSMITAVGGGMLRDMLINQIPFVLRENFYASVSVIVAVYLYLTGFAYENIFFVLIAGVVIRFVAHKKNWKLPTF